MVLRFIFHSLTLYYPVHARIHTPRLYNLPHTRYHVFCSVFSWSSRSLYSNRLVSYDQTNVDIKTGLRCARRFSHLQNFIQFYPYMKFLFHSRLDLLFPFEVH